MTNTIQHQGIIDKIDGSHIDVRIIQTTACSSCSARGHCSSSNNKEKIIEIIDQYATYEVGESVMVIGETSMGLKAVFIAFVVPFLWVISFLFIFMHFYNSELFAAVLALISLAPYYMILWMMRDRIKRNFTFKIKPIK